MKFIYQACLAILISTSGLAHAHSENQIVDFSLHFECGPSPFQNHVVNCIPKSQDQSSNKHEWVEDTIEQMESLIALLRSGEFRNAKVNFQSNRKNFADWSQQAIAKGHISLLCKPCKELEQLRSLVNQTANTQNSYDEWEKETLAKLLLLQMITFNHTTEYEKASSHININFEITADHSPEITALQRLNEQYDPLTATPEEEIGAILDLVYNCNKLIFGKKFQNGYIDFQITDNQNFASQ